MKYNNMKKLIVAILLLIGVSNVTHAYIIQAGPRIGISTTHIVFDKDLRKCYDPEIGLGYQLGVLARITLPIIYIQPELLFTSNSAKVEYQCKSEINANKQSHILKYKKLELPIIIGMKFLELIRLQAGPVFSILIAANDNDADITSNYSRITAGYQAGIGVDIHRFLIDIKFEGSLSKFGNKLGEISADHRENLLIFSVGINLL
jgi:hypothetical protein